MPLVPKKVADEGSASWPLASIGSLHDRVVHSRRVRVLAQHFAELFSPGESILDVGCGDGLLDRLILDQRPDLAISGVDVLVREQTHIPVTEFDGNRLPFPDGAFETVMFADVLHHTTSPTDLVMEAARVARKSVAIKDHVVQGLLAWPTLRFMDYVGNAPHGVALPYNYLTQDEWTRLFSDCHLRAREVRTKLKIYPPWADCLFGRKLHFVGIFDRVI